MTELTADLIVSARLPGELTLSPDGRTVAYTLAPIGKREPHPLASMWLAATDGLTPPRPLTTDTCDNRRAQWSPDGAQIAFLSDRAERGTLQLYVIPVAGGEARPLTPAANKRPVRAFAWSPDGAQIAYTCADEPDDEEKRREKERDDAVVFGERLLRARLRVMMVATGETRTLTDGNRHVSELAWSPDGSQIAFATWPAPAEEFSGRDTRIDAVPATGGDARLVARLGRQRLRGLVWSGDGRRLLFIGSASRHAQSSGALWAVDAIGGDPVHLAFGEESCASDLAQPRGSSRALAVVAAGIDTQLHWIDAQTGALDHFYAASEETPVRDILAATAVVPPHSTPVLAAVRAGGDKPWEVWSAQASSGVPVIWSALTAHQTAFDGIRFGEQEPFYWQAPDGLMLDGIFVRPANDLTPPWPTVVLVHGGPYGRFAQGFFVGWGQWAQWLATAGYAVLLPNPRGGMGHGERFAAAARGDVGGADWLDVASAADAAVARGLADPARLGIGGWSQGGFMTAWATTQTRRFKAAIMGAGVSDWGMLTLTSDVPDFESELGGNVPWDGPGARHDLALSPIMVARRAATPILILHGQNDERVPVSQAVGFHRAMRDVGVPSELVIYPREPHGIGERAHQIDVLVRVRAWYARWL
ncbi:MAG: S9 family peptidase [Chloroflexi bacterium]|nr:S9 family peptidase [Chloroflexota bacterium]